MLSLIEFLVELENLGWIGFLVLSIILGKIGFFCSDWLDHSPDRVYLDCSSNHIEFFLLSPCICINLVVQFLVYIWLRFFIVNLCVVVLGRLCGRRLCVLILLRCVLLKPTISWSLIESNQLHREYYFLPNNKSNLKSYLEKHLENSID